MLVKEQDVAAEPDASKADRRSGKLVPDYAKQAKTFLESRVAATFNSPATPTDATFPDHPAAEPFRVASVLQAQQQEGNYYVEQAIVTYAKRAKVSPAPPPVDPRTLTKEKTETEAAPKPADYKPQEPKQETSQEAKQRAAAAKPATQPTTEPAASTKAPAAATPARDTVEKQSAGTAGATKAQPPPTPAKALPGTTRSGGAKADSQTAGGARRGGDPVAAWQGKVHRSVTGIKPAHVKASDTATLNNAAKQSEAKHGQAAKGLQADGKKAVTPPKQPAGMPPIPDDLSKEAIAVMDSKCGRKLDQHTLPRLAEQSPLGHIPIIGKEPPVKVPTVPDANKDPEPGKKDDHAKGKQTKDQKEKSPEATQTDEQKEAERKKQLMRDGEVVRDAPPPPLAEVPEGRKIDIGSVIADLILDEKNHSHKIVQDARNEAFGSAATSVEAVFGVTLDSEELVIVDSELHRLAEAAGLEKDDLQKKIDERRKNLAQLGKDVKDDQTSVAADARKREEEASKQYIQEIDTVRSWLERSAIERQNSVKGKVDAQKIQSDRERLIASVNQKAATWHVNYESARKQFKDALDAAALRQLKAYDVAAQEDEVLLEKDADTEDKKKAARVAYRPTKYWLDDQRSALAKAVEIDKVAIDSQADDYERELKAAADDSREKIRDYAAKKLGYERGFIQSLLDWIMDWVNQSKIESNAWAQKRAEENKIVVDKDDAFLNSEITKLSKMTDTEIEKEIRTLDQEQYAIIKAFFESKGQDRVGAVAAGLMVHISNQQRPDLVKKLEQEVLASQDPENVNKVAEARNKSFRDQAAFKAIHLHDAFKGPGTNEDLVFETLGGLTAIEAHAVELEYERRYKEKLRDRLKDELDDWATFTSHDIDRANAMMAGDDASAVAVELDQAMHGTTLGLGITTDSDTIFKALRNKSPSQVAAIKKAYREKYGRDLQLELNDQLDHWYVSGTHDVDRMHALMEGDTVTADVVALDKAMHGGWLGLGIGTDRAGIEQVYDQQKAELKQKADAKGWSSDKLKAEIQKRSDALDDTYGKKYGKDFTDRKPGQSALDAAYEDELSGSELQLIMGKRRDDLAKVSAATIDIEHHSMFYADDATINKALQDQYTTVFDDKKRNLDLAIDEEMEADRKSAFAKDDPESYYKKWTPEKIRAEHKKAEKQAEIDAQGPAADNFAKLETEYDSQYKKKFTLGGILTSTPSLGLKQDVLNDTQFTQHKKAAKLLEQHGYLSDVQEMRYAVMGAGTDDDKVRGAFKGKNKDEMSDFRKRWAEDPENKKLGIKENLDDWVLGDFSGRDHEEMQLNLKYGESPDNPQDQLQKAKDLRDFENKGTVSHYFFGTGDDELKLLDQDVNVLQKRVDAFNDFKVNHQNDKQYWQKYADLKGDIDSQNTIVEASVASHRHTVDVVSDTAAQAIGAVVTAIIIVASIAADVATFGGAAAATPAEGAAIGALWSVLGLSLAGTALTMASKVIIKGTDAYGWEEISEDAAVGIVDALLAAATAGTAGKLLKGGSQMLMKLAEKKALGKIVATFLAHAAEGAIQSTPGAILGNAMNKDNYKNGNAILNILEGAALQVAPGAILSGGIGAFHGALKDDMLFRARTDPEFQDRVFKKFEASPKTSNKTRADFLAQLDHLIEKETTNGFKDPKLQEQLRTRVMEHIPPGQKGLFKDFPVRVISDQEFKAFTKSASGNAVTVFQDGKPTVIVKAGTDLTQLGEEGIHLSQSREEATASKVRKLDETNLQHWDKMDLDTQLDLYKTKLDLEIDAHERIAEALENQKAAARDPDALARQIEKNKANLENLKNRELEVAALQPQEKLEMQAGTKPKPQYLEQPARLFAKDATLPKPEVEVEGKLRPLDEVRREFESLKQAESKGPLTEEQQAHLQSVRKELESHYATQEGESLQTTEKRLFEQRPKETLEQYRKRLEAMRTEVEHGGNANLDIYLRYEDLLGEISTDIESAEKLRGTLAKTRKAARAINEELLRQRRNLHNPYADRTNEPFASPRMRDALELKAQQLERQIKTLENRHQREPWKLAPLNDQMPNERKSVYGELETGVRMQDAGCKPKGATLDTQNIVRTEDLENAIKKRRGIQDIDHLYEPPDRTRWATYAVESKTTSQRISGDPIGRGLLGETNNGWQLSDKWLIGNARKSGLKGAELTEFITEVAKGKNGKVRRIYSVTDPRYGTRFFEVEPIGDTDVRIGKEITSEFRKKP